MFCVEAMHVSPSLQGPAIIFPTDVNTFEEMEAVVQREVTRNGINRISVLKRGIPHIRLESVDGAWKFTYC